MSTVNVVGVVRQLPSQSRLAAARRCRCRHPRWPSRHSCRRCCRYTRRCCPGHGLEAEGVLDQEGLVSVGEDLDVELPAEVTVGGGLREEHLLIGTRDAVGAAGQNVPSPTNGRADVHVAAGAKPDFPGGDVGVDEKEMSVSPAPRSGCWSIPIVTQLSYRTFSSPGMV